MNAVLKLLRNFAEQLFQSIGYESLILVKCCSVHCFNVWLDTIKGNENQLLDLFYSAKLY